MAIRDRLSTQDKINADKLDKTTINNDAKRSKYANVIHTHMLK